MQVDAPVLRGSGDWTLLTEPIEVDEPHDGEVRVRMAATGVCRSCLSVADGTHVGMPMPVVLGDEGAGVVEAVGRGCRLVPGDHVVISWSPGCGRCRWCAQGRPGLCSQPPAAGVMADGTTRFRSLDGSRVYHFGPATYAPFTVVPERAAVPIREDMPLEVAALIGCSVTTGWGGVVNAARPAPGDSVAVFGCGGVGLNAIQGAALAGAFPVLAVDVLDSKLELARRFGATHAVRADAEDLPNALRSLTAGGVDHAIVAVGQSRVVEQAVECLGTRGQCVILGNPHTGASITLSPHHLLYGERRILGSVYGSANPQVDFPRLVELYLAGRLQLDELVTHRYRPEEAAEAFRALAAGEQARGLIVFEPS